MSSVQPKFKDCFYDYDKHPENLRAWIALIGNLVRSIEHGIALELFLDKYLKRQSPTNFTKPAFLDDPVLSLPHVTNATSDEEPEAQSDAISQVLHGLQQEVAPQRYELLHPEAQQLDIILYTTLCTILQGTMLKIAGELRGPYARRGQPESSHEAQQRQMNSQDGHGQCEAQRSP